MKIQQADDMILSDFMRTDVLFAASRDQPEGLGRHIKFVVACLGVKTFGIFVISVKLVREYERPLILRQFLSVNMRWAVDLLYIMATRIADNSHCPPEMARARTIISIHNASAHVGPTWYYRMEELLLELSLSSDVCSPNHGARWRVLAGIERFCYFLDHLWRTRRAPKIPEHAGAELFGDGMVGFLQE